MFTIKLTQPAQEGFIKDGWNKLNTWAEKQNAAKAAKLNNAKPSSTKKETQKFSSIGQAFDYFLPHKEDIKYTYSDWFKVSYGSDEMELAFNKNVLDTRYRNSVVSAYNAIRSALPKVIEVARKDFLTSTDVLDDSPDATPLSRQELSKILPSWIDIDGVKDSDKVTLNYHFDMGDFYHNLDTSDRNMVRNCIMGIYKDGVSSVRYVD